MKAIKVLIVKAKELQREIVNQGRVSSMQVLTLFFQGIHMCIQKIGSFHSQGVLRKKLQMDRGFGVSCQTRRSWCKRINVRILHAAFQYC
jgi:hypothetical protein